MLIEEAVIDQHNTLIRVFLHFVRLVLVRNSAISSLHNREHHFSPGNWSQSETRKYLNEKKNRIYTLLHGV